MLVGFNSCLDPRRDTSLRANFSALSITWWKLMESNHLCYKHAILRSRPFPFGQTSVAKIFRRSSLEISIFKSAVCDLSYRRADGGGGGGGKLSAHRFSVRDRGAMGTTRAS
jgi:hypothetical protein